MERINHKWSIADIEGGIFDNAAGVVALCSLEDDLLQNIAHFLNEHSVYLLESSDADLVEQARSEMGGALIPGSALYYVEPNSDEAAGDYYSFFSHNLSESESLEKLRFNALSAYAAAEREEEAASYIDECLKAAEVGVYDKYMPLPWAQLAGAHWFVGTSDTCYADDDERQLMLAYTLTSSSIEELTLDDLSDDKREEVEYRFALGEGQEYDGAAVRRLYKIETGEMEGSGYLLLDADWDVA